MIMWGRITRSEGIFSRTLGSRTGSGVCITVATQRKRKREKWGRRHIGWNKAMFYGLVTGDDGNGA